MDIAVIGAGVTGLTAAYELARAGHNVTVIERDRTPGGLASGFSMPGWEWPLEKWYHHYFTNDRALIGLSQELGIRDRMMTLHPETAVYLGGNVSRLDSAMSLLRFPRLSPAAKIRTALLIGLAKSLPYMPYFGSVPAKDLAIAVGGMEAWKTVWEPLVTAKFGPYADQVAASWLWARIKKRTPALGYFRGGFRTFTDALSRAVIDHGGTILLNTPTTHLIQASAGRWLVSFTHEGKKNMRRFDRVLLTVPTPIAAMLAPFPKPYISRLLRIRHLFAQVLILETDVPVLDRVYWLNVNDRSFPFLAVVAHTNMVSKEHYGNRHITYIGNYLPGNHPYLTKTGEQLLTGFLPYLRKLNPSLARRNIKRLHVFNAPYAQPVHTVNYANNLPGPETPLTHLYLANLDSIYPWDRGTNYAVELGKTAAETIISDRI